MSELTVLVSFKLVSICTIMKIYESINEMISV